MFDIGKWARAMRNEQEGFTLVELMVVVVIIGILVAIAVPIYNTVQDTAADNACEANIRTIEGAYMIYEAEGDDAQTWPDNYLAGGEKPDCPHCESDGCADDGCYDVQDDNSVNCECDDH